MKILITGGSGFIGQTLIDKLLSEGHEVVNLSRSPRKSARKGYSELKYNGKSIPEAAGSPDAVINLAGAGVADKRWTDAYKKVIRQSRVDVTQACVTFIQGLEHKPRVFISASGYNYYGVLVEEPVDESSPPGEGFLPSVCVDWEAAAEGAGVRTVLLRTSAVLGKEGGPVPKMVTPFKFFVGGPVGSGKQGFPWIHIDDVVGAILFVLENESVEGPVNLNAPEQVTAGQFAKAMGKALGRPSWFRVPKWLLQLVFGELSSILWGGAFVDNRKLREAGYTYRHADLKSALQAIFQKK